MTVDVYLVIGVIIHIILMQMQCCAPHLAAAGQLSATIAAVGRYPMIMMMMLMTLIMVTTTKLQILMMRTLMMLIMMIMTVIQDDYHHDYDDHKDAWNIKLQNPASTAARATEAGTVGAHAETAENASLGMGP